MASKGTPLLVALPLFLQNVDVGSIATALPAIAGSLHVATLTLNLAVTAYLISLAIFLPASGWLAERFGPKRVFCWSIGLFTVGSALCGLAQTVPQLVSCRVLQGVGGALMLPVGRLLLLRSVPPGAVVEAMIWFTIPPAVGRLVGPLVGGLVLAWASWRYVFVLNVVVGIAAVVLSILLLDEDEVSRNEARFDIQGFVLLAGGLALLLAGLQASAGQTLSHVWSRSMICIGGVLLLLYGHRSRRTLAPLIDLTVVRYRSFFASVIAGFPLRLAVGAGPFILPLAFQLGFGLTALETGALMTVPAVASLSARGMTRWMITRFGFRSLLLTATLVSATAYSAYFFFSAATPRPVLIAALLIGGLANSLVMVTLQALAFSEVPQPLMGHATALSTMAQQVSASLGVLMCVEFVRASAFLRDDIARPLALGDFTSTISVLGAAVFVSALMFVKLPKDVGADLR